MSVVRNAAAIAAALQVAACGGGGGGGSAPTSPVPPPPPPPPGSTNTSLLNLTSSEDFTNVAATGAATYQTSGGQSANGSLTPATIHYDAASKSYTITNGPRSQSFAPANLSAADSNDTVAVYIKRNGSITDSLTLTKPGTSGPLTYQYVGGAYWQRTNTGSSTITGSLDALAYGVETPDSALPRSGRAEYAVDLLAIEANYGGVNGLVGQGVTQVDFARGVVVTHGTLVPETTPSVFGDFSSEARISSTSNSFAGTFRLYEFGLFTGQLQGQFFGPQAQEIGAAFYGTDGGGQRVVAGTILGRGGSVHSANASVKTPTVNEFFAGDAVKLTTKISGQESGYNSTGSGPTSSTTKSDSVIVNYDASTQKYTVIAPDRSQYFDGHTSYGMTSEYLSNTTPQDTLGIYGYYDGAPYATFTNLQYVATKEWFKRNGNDYTIEPLVYGIQTSASAMPRTGRGDYAIGLSGTAADNDFPNLVKFKGFGFLNADFATGTLTLDGQLRYQEDYIIAGVRPRGEGTGTFSGSGTISSSSNSFSGAINLTGFGAYSGTMNGRFFGPTAGEIGAAFQASDGAGGQLVGTFAGGLDAAAAPSTTTLATLTQPTSLAFSSIHWTSAPDVIEVAYDPQAGGYTLKLNDTHLAGAPVHTLTLNDANRDAAASNASYDVHTVTLNGVPHVASILKALPSNPTISLRYTSLAQLVGASPSLPSDRYYVAFGLPTTTRMPIGGTATYHGVAVGAGSVQTNAYSGGALPSTTTLYNLSGTTSMTVDFASLAFTSTLNLTGTDISSSGTYAFPTFTFNGDISFNTFSTHSNGATYLGKFFGPNAEEFGGTFDIFKSDAADTLFELKGAFVGKR